ncbi:hypothetical protein LEP1GSC021_2125 [Leptospira noguchii str. 1993005606]|uniref:Uncharacterized protein n=1 Tax=Leptospira noguchii str. 2007001578 TaxID=1049974 RepID=A0ABN0IX45_9LEPT|nr:hypothetical protein LEP1GSC035_4042 [Leptospira noguchii str. 2007001578]EPE86218.1 hypothetical protein LEP1GSC021_2125 [Leptospira noguchii str. 1993005606]
MKLKQTPLGFGTSSKFRLIKNKIEKIQNKELSSIFLNSIKIALRSKI